MSKSDYINNIFTVLDYVQMGLLAIDKNYIVLFWNQCIENWTEINKKDIIGSDLREFFPNLKDRKYTGRVESILTGGLPVVFSSYIHKDIFTSILPNGEKRIQHVTVTSVPGYCKDEYYALFAVEDVTEKTRRIDELKESGGILKQARNQANAANVAKSEFLANISHELLSPLNSIVVLSENLIENEQTNSYDLESLKIINKSGKNLHLIVGDILEFSKIDTGKVNVEINHVNINNLISYLHRSFDYCAKEKNLEFIIKSDHNLPQKIETDEKKLKKILKNLISNALKFTEKGKVKIYFRTVTTCNSVEHGNMIEISISDTGIGIPFNKQGEIFNLFDQVDGTTTRKFDGTGLGLAISKKLLTFLDGKIYLKSESGLGSTFIIVLPEKLDFKKSKESINNHDAKIVLINSNIKQDKKLALKKTIIMDKIEDSAILNNKKLLIIDDDMRNLLILSKIFEQKQANVIKASSGIMAINKLKEHEDINLILHNMNMPKINGCEILLKIRSINKYLNTPIIVLLNDEKEFDEEKYNKVGVTDYFAKPFDINKIISFCIDSIKN